MNNNLTKPEELFKTYSNLFQFEEGSPEKDPLNVLPWSKKRKQ